MCGIAAIAGSGWTELELRVITEAQAHRGPDSQGLWTSPDGVCGLGHRRLSIIDLSRDSDQPMWNARGDVHLVFNGEIYNYRELRAELADYPFRTKTDSEVILAAYERWGIGAVERFIGMFAFVLWDERTRTLHAVRDRFGVKPLYLAKRGEAIYLASEIAALRAAGFGLEPDATAWATYLSFGLYDHTTRGFWHGVESIPAGGRLEWRDGRLRTAKWYDLAERVGPELDTRPEEQVAEEYKALMLESMALRFRSDVPVGVNLSGGLDSSLALALIDRLEGKGDTRAFTYITGDPAYDELPWVEQMLAGSDHPLTAVQLYPEDVPELAASVQRHQSEPFGGLPTLAYAKVHDAARAQGVIVLIDGQGLDEQWGGYNYYAKPQSNAGLGPVQGSKQRSVRPECLRLEFAALAEPFDEPRPFADDLRNRQYYDAVHAKIPRALRFNDRVSMRASTELREPFLDHRLFELALRQPADRKIRDGIHKRLLRGIAGSLVPKGIHEAPKRPVQTPQREWLRGPLQGWTSDCVEAALREHGGSWFDRRMVEDAWREYQRGESDNSFYVWQWLSVGLSAIELQGVAEAA